MHSLDCAGLSCAFQIRWGKGLPWLHCGLLGWHSRPPLKWESCPAAFSIALQWLRPEGDAEGANIRELSEEQRLEQLCRKERIQVLRQVTHHVLEQAEPYSDSPLPCTFTLSRWRMGTSGRYKTLLPGCWTALLHFALLQVIAPGVPKGKKLHRHSGTWKGSLADQPSCPELIPVLLLMQKKQQGVTTIILKPGLKLKVSESNRWKTLEFPVRPLDDTESDPSDLSVPAPSHASWHSISTAS